MCKGYIYRHWIVNDKGQEKSYIGQVYNRTPQQRWGTNGRGYLQKRKDGQYSYFGKTIKKYGWDNFQHKVLLTIECETLEELVFWLDQWEAYYIEKYDSFYNGYNGTNGGKNGYIVTDETKNRQSESHKKYYDTEQGLKLCKRYSERMSGELNPFYGEHHSNEVRKVLSEQAKQRTGSKSTRGKKTICLETKQIFDTAKQASEWCHGNVKNHCQGKTSYAGKHPVTGEKLHWMYYKDYLKLQNELNELN